MEGREIAERYGFIALPSSSSANQASQPHRQTPFVLALKKYVKYALGSPLYMVIQKWGAANAESLSRLEAFLI